MPTVQRFLLALCFCASVALSSCAARVASTPTVPGRPVKPLENVLVWNAALANANLGVANNVITAQQAIPPLMSVDAANTILTAQSMIADGDRQLTFVLQTLGTCQTATPAATNCKANATRVGALISQIEASANAIIANDVGIKDAATSKAITTAMNSIFTLAQQMIGTLQAGGLLQ